MSRNNRNLSLKRLRDQVMVITGATSGIGLVTAREAARQGARLVLVARGASALEQLATELRARGTDALAVPGDVGKDEDVRHAARRAIEHFGGFDTWFNNAGVTIYGRLTDISLEDQRRLFDTNFWGVVHGSRAAIEHLRYRGGALINMGSITSDRAIPLQGIYSASKHAIKAYTDALRMELEHDSVPVSVSLIKPSSIDTPYSRHGKNYLPFVPRNPPPVYAPMLVADAVLHCAENRRRDITVGGGGRMLTAMSSNAPRSTDEIMEETLFDLQETSTTARDRGDGNLYHPMDELEERGGYGSGVSESSVYTRAMLSSGSGDGFADLAGAITRTLWRATRGNNDRPGRPGSNR